MSPALPYLHHLDGLRALALLGVLGFHFQVPLCQGGYLGVDCFLVLSGFLMTRIISSSIIDSSFRLREFYISRFWRLFPSALCTIFSCLVCSFLIFTPDVALQVCKSALAAVFSGSNWYFFSVSGYFDTSASMKPLLHTWSLSMEEQFYLVWPPLLLLFSKPFKTGRWDLFASFTLALCLTSILFSATRGTSRSEGFDFFLLPARLFEFGVGALMHAASQLPSPAYLNQSLTTEKMGYPKSEGRLGGFMAHVLAETGSWTGLGLIFTSYMRLPPASPVYLSLPSVVGTALLIMTPTAMTNRAILGNACSRSLGRIAYSVYLVHWPIYVYFRYVGKAMKVRLLSNPIILFAASIFFGLCLHKSVETRFRFKKGARVPASSVVYILLLSAATIYVSWTGIATHGWRFRGKTRHEAIHEPYTMPREKRHLVVKNRALVRASKMVIVGKGLDSPAAKLLLENFSHSNFQTIVVGNSFTSSILPAYYKAHEKGDRYFLFNYRGGCPLNVPPKKPAEGKRSDCSFVNDEIWQNVRMMPANSTVVLTNDWQAYSDGFNGTKRNGFLAASALAAAVRKLGHHPVVFGAAPGISNHGEVYACVDLLFILNYWGFDSESMKARCRTMGKPRHDFLGAEVNIQRAIGDGEANFLYLSSVRDRCSRNSTSSKYSCVSTVEVGGATKSMYDRDGKHLSFYGAVGHTDLVRSMVKTMQKRRGAWKAVSTKKKMR